MGHIIRPGRVAIEQACDSSLVEVKEPCTQTELRSFIGLVSVYRRFISKFSDIAARLNALLREENPTKLGKCKPEQLEASNSLKEAVTSVRVLLFPKLGLTSPSIRTRATTKLVVLFLKPLSRGYKIQSAIGHAHSLSTSGTTPYRRMSALPSSGR